MNRSDMGSWMKSVVWFWETRYVSGQGKLNENVTPVHSTNGVRAFERPQTGNFLTLKKKKNDAQFIRRFEVLLFTVKFIAPRIYLVFPDGGRPFLSLLRNSAWRGMFSWTKRRRSMIIDWKLVPEVFILDYYLCCAIGENYSRWFVFRFLHQKPNKTLRLFFRFNWNACRV